MHAASWRWHVNKAGSSLLNQCSWITFVMGSSGWPRMIKIISSVSCSSIPRAIFHRDLSKKKNNIFSLIQILVKLLQIFARDMFNTMETFSDIMTRNAITVKHIYNRIWEMMRNMLMNWQPHTFSTECSLQPWADLHVATFHFVLTSTPRRHAELSSYPGYFREPHWKSQGLTEISMVTKQLWSYCYFLPSSTGGQPYLFALLITNKSWPESCIRA